MKNTLRLLALAFCICLAFALASCGKGNSECKHRDADDNRKCDYCQDTYIDGKDVVDPVCQHRDTDGNGYCDACGKYFNNASDYTEHQHRDADDDMECDLCGEDYDDQKEPCNCNHWWFNKDSTCGVCGISLEGEVPYGHRDVDDDSKCDFCGTEYTDYEDIGSDGHTHAYGGWVLEYVEGVPCHERHLYKTCSVCGYKSDKEGVYESHSFEYVITAPSCTEKGYTTKTCTTCNYYETYNIKATIAHTYGEWVLEDVKGVPCHERHLYQICSVCGGTTSKNAGYEDHTLISSVVNPTCLNGGYTENICSVCGFSEQVDLTDALGHNFVGAYLFDDTYHWQKCERCEATSTPTEHTAVGADGYCTACDKILGYTEGVVYDLSSDGTYAEVIYYNGSSERVVIASEYMGVPVTSIYKQAFKNAGITSVIIPDSVISIGDEAFYGCSKLSTVVILGSVEKIGAYAFYSCKSLKDFVIPDGVTSIGGYAFYNCSSVTELVLPDSLTSIGGYAFYNCSSVTELVLPDSLTSIGGYAFLYCSAITDLVIPNSVISIGDCAFANCSSLKNITLGFNVSNIYPSSFSGCAEEIYAIYGNCKYLGNEENPYMVLISAENKLYSSYTIHEDTVVIASQAFKGCERMGSICIPASVRYIGAYAFSSCSSLTSVTFADPYGWNYIYNESLRSVSADLLSDPAEAKRYLVDSKYSYNWEKIDTAA